MRDSKLKSKDLIRIRQALGGGDQATTQTARIARKLAEKTAKRNKITVAFINRPSWDPDVDYWNQQGTFFEIKRGGVPVAGGDMEYHSGKEIGIGTPGKIKVNAISALSKEGWPEGYDWEASSLHARKTLRPKEIKAALKAVAKRYPGADRVLGTRSTGAHALGIGGSRQRMNLPKVEPGPSRLEKALHANSSRLRGAMKGVEMLPAKLSKAIVKATPSAPLEAAAVTYAQTGSAPAAAASAATTTAIGAGIRKAFTTAAKHAPVVARVAGRAAAPLAVATAGYDLFRAGQEGTRAYQAKQDALKNEKYMSDNYGSIEAATATRRRRHESRNPL